MSQPAPVLSTDGLAASGSDQLAAWLAAQQLSLAFTTYRANRLLLLGTAESDSPEQATLKLHERLFDRPMGLFADGESLWMAGRCQLWRLDNHLGAGQRHEGGDRLYVPAVSLITGDVNAHEVVIAAGGQLLFVNTAFSCLAAIEPGSSFAPSWQPPFITQLAGDDRCHLNGVALVDGEPTWASACGGNDGASSWRNNRASGGVLIHIPSGDLAATGLSMPHSPRWHNGRLWLLNSGSGELGWIEDGAFRPLCTLPGFARGLAFAGGCAVVGLSKLRSPQFTGLPLEERLAAEGLPGGVCGLRVIDLNSGSCLHSFDLPEPIDELFDVVVLPGVRQPRALGLQGEAIDCLVKLPDRPELVQVRPMAPSGHPHQGPEIRSFGLPEASAALPSADPTTIRYQRVFHFTPANLAPYAALTSPALSASSGASCWASRQWRTARWWAWLWRNDKAPGCAGDLVDGGASVARPGHRQPCAGPPQQISGPGRREGGIHPLPDLTRWPWADGSPPAALGLAGTAAVVHAAGGQGQRARGDCMARALSPTAGLSAGGLATAQRV